MRVLLVDDDELFGQLLRGFLDEQGWVLQRVNGGRDALRQWNELAPDLLLTEIESEQMDGLEFIEEVRQEADPPPIVICSRVPGVRTWAPSVLDQLGVAAAVVRPVGFGELFDVLQSVAEGRG